MVSATMSIFELRRTWGTIETELWLQDRISKAQTNRISQSLLKNPSYLNMFDRKSSIPWDQSMNPKPSLVLILTAYSVIAYSRTSTLGRRVLPAVQYDGIS
ncbi:hypothetical protein Droror1_Dr00010201 [Drosera rotundifolia]